MVAWAVAAALVALAFALRGGWLMADFDAQVVGILPDDAFYYYEIALRLLHGEGLRFDGVAASTGYHPLWLLAVTPLFVGAEFGDTVPITRVLVLCTLLAAAASFVLFRFARELGLRTLPALLLAVAFSANGWLLLESLNGLETIASLLLLALALLAGVRLREAPSRGRAVTLGVVSALSILARSDSAVILVALYALLLWRFPWRLLAIAALPPCVAVAAIVLGNLALTGAPLPSSATSVPWLVRANWERFYGADGAAVGGMEGLVRSLRMLAPLGLVAASGLALWLATLPWTLRRSAPQQLRIAAAALGLMALGLVALHVVHGYVRIHPRSWYFVGWIVVAYAGAAVGIVALRERLTAYARIEALAIALLALVATVETGRALQGTRESGFTHQGEMLEAARNLRLYVSGDEPVGAFNAGIFAYVSGARVVNLDGVVNEDAARALRAGALASYLRERDIRHLLDYPIMWSQVGHELAAGSFFGAAFTWVPMQELARFDDPDVGFTSPEHGVLLERLHWDLEDWDGRLAFDLADYGSCQHCVGAWWLPAVHEEDWIELRAREGSFHVPLLRGRAYAATFVAAAPLEPQAGACTLWLERRRLGAFEPGPDGFSELRFALPAPQVQDRNRLRLDGPGCVGLRLQRLALEPLPG